VISFTLWMNWNSFVLFVILHIIFAFFVSYIDVPTNSITGEWDPETAASAINFLHFAFGVGAVVTPYIFEWCGLILTYIIFGSLSLICLILSVLLIVIFKTPKENESFDLDAITQKLEKQTKIQVEERSTSSLMESQTKKTLNDPLEGTSPESDDEIRPKETQSQQLPQNSQSVWREVLDLMKNLQYWMVVIAVLFYVGAEMVTGGWVNLLFAEIGYGSFSTLATTLYWGGVLGGRLTFSLVSRKLVSGIKSTILNLRILAPLAVVSPCIFIIVAVSAPEAALLVLVVLIGVSFSAILPLLVAITGNIFANAHGSTMLSVMGVLLAANLGGAIFPLGTGVLSSHFSVRSGMWMGVACIVCLNIVVNIFATLYNRKSVVMNLP